MAFQTTADLEIPVGSHKQIEVLEQQARTLARSVEEARQRTLANFEQRIEALEQKARDLALFAETTRQQFLLQSDMKTEQIRQKAQDLAHLVESMRQRTTVHTDSEIEDLGQRAQEFADFALTVRKETLLQFKGEIVAMGEKASDLAIAVEAAREKTLLQSETNIEALSQKARDLAVSVEAAREMTLLQSETDIEALSQKARDLAISVEAAREMTLLQSETDIEALGKKARDLAVSVEAAREMTLLQSETDIEALDQKARDLAVSVEAVREEALLQSETEIKGLKQRARNLAFSVEQSRVETLLESDRVIRKLNADLEQRVLERTGQLETANKELEAFSYSVSHDLRAPLRAIDGFSRILLDEYAASVSDEVKSFLQLIKDNTRQMAQLVDDLLAFSRLGRLALGKQTVDPAKIVRLCLSEMPKEQEGRNVEIIIGELPTCQADPTLLKQVWLNLLSNALKYTRKREAVRIEVGSRTTPRPLSNGHARDSSERETETVYFVKDNGAGFDMKYAHKLFGVFQRLHRAADYDGTGVGLAIVQRIINRHGGRVWGEAMLNQGATFSFTLA